MTASSIPPEAAAAALVVVSAVLAVAGVAKLRDHDRTLLSFQALGFPDWFVAPAALVVPVVELTLAVGLWLPATRVVAAGASALLFVAFTLVIARTVLQGRRVRCGCFGDLGQRPVSWWTVLRNVVLAGLAATLATATPGTGPVTDAITRDGLTIALTAVVVGLVVALALTVRTLLDVLHRYGRLLETVDPTPVEVSPLDVGDAAPDVATVELDGPTERLAQLWSEGRQALLVFADPACVACRDLVPRVAQWASAHPEVATAVISPRSWRKAQQDHAGSGVHWLVDRDLEAFDAYRLAGTPSVVLVGDGRVLAAPARGNRRVEGLLALAGGPGEVLRHGVVAPDGAEVELADALGAGRRLLFWNPDCRYCRELVEAHADDPAPLVVDGEPVLVVASGSPARLGELPPGWRAVADPAVRAMLLAGVPGTPSVARLDAAGHVVDTAVGIHDVRTALGWPDPVADPDGVAR